ncbi:OprD family outer membrane porin [Azotobacter vinelandii]
MNVQSGYTEGPVGFAVGLTSKTGVKLDSSPDRVGTGLLAYGPDGKAESSYSQFDFVLKARAAQTELAVGGLTPMVPILVSPTVRLFPPVFRGAQMKSGEFRDLTLHAGYFDRIEERNSTNFEALRIASPWGAFRVQRRGQSLRFRRRRLPLDSRAGHEPLLRLSRRCVQAALPGRAVQPCPGARQVAA